MSETVHDELAQALRDLASRFGDSAFTDRRRLVSLLSDRLPDARRDIKVVSAAVDERVFATLARTRPEQLPLEIERLAARLEAGHGIDPELAVPIVHACAYGLSLGPLPSRQDTGARARPRSVPAGGAAWVGLSEPGPAPTAPPVPPPAAARARLGPASLVACIAVALAAAAAAGYVLLRRDTASAALAPAPSAPTLAAPLPTRPPFPRLAATLAPHGHAVAFRFDDHGGTYDASVYVDDDWLYGSLAIWRGGDPAGNVPKSRSVDDGFTFVDASNTHALHTTWDRNDLAIHDFCITFRHAPDTITLPGSQLCLSEAAGQDCRLLGCGDVQ